MYNKRYNKVYNQDNKKSTHGIAHIVAALYIGAASVIVGCAGSSRTTDDYDLRSRLPHNQPINFLINVDNETYSCDVDTANGNKNITVKRVLQDGIWEIKYDGYRFVDMGANGSLDEVIEADNKHIRTPTNKHRTPTPKETKKYEDIYRKLSASISGK